MGADNKELQIRSQNAVERSAECSNALSLESIINLDAETELKKSLVDAAVQLSAQEIERDKLQIEVARLKAEVQKNENLHEATMERISVERTKNTDAREIEQEKREVEREKMKSAETMQREKQSHEIKKINSEGAWKFFTAQLIPIFIIFALIAAAAVFVGKKVMLKLDDEVKIAESAEYFEGMNYKKAETILKEYGFDDIVLVPIDDDSWIEQYGLIEWLHKDTHNQVISVTIDGEMDFEDGTKFEKDSRVEIIYYVIPGR